MRRAQVKHTKKHVLVLCNLGHLIDSHSKARSYAGSAFEAELAFRHKGDRFDRLATACKGFGHPKKLTQMSLFPTLTKKRRRKRRK